MNNIISFIKSFINRSGNYVLSATILSRLLSFFASWIALQLIPNRELGIVIYAFQIILFIIPVAGFGLQQGLIRYGALLKTDEEKNSLLIYTIKKGFLVNLAFVILIIIATNTIKFTNNTTPFYLILLSLAIFSYYILELIKIQFRLYKNNKLFSYVEFSFNLILVLLVFILSYYFKELGYAISLIIAPLITVLLFVNKLNIKSKNQIKLNITNAKFWQYGFFASLSNVGAKLLIAIDIILIGNILKDMELVTAFKYVSLIPFSLIFLSQVFITTDFVEFTEKISDKKHITNYIKNYMKLFFIISISIIGFVYFFGAFILSLFDVSYIEYQNSLLVLTIGVSGILIIRGLFGNLLSSIGKAHINFIITFTAIILNILLNNFLIPKYDLFGAAITSGTLMWFTGIISLLFFFYFYFIANSSDK